MENIYKRRIRGVDAFNSFMNGCKTLVSLSRNKLNGRDEIDLVDDVFENCLK